MKNRAAIPIALGVLALGFSIGVTALAQTTIAPNPGGDAPVSGAIEQKPILTAAQRSAIYQEVIKDKKKNAAKDFSPVIGADVPPMIELYTLPDAALSEIPAVQLYKYTVVQDKVVLVDPTRMRIVDVISP